MPRTPPTSGVDRPSITPVVEAGEPEDREDTATPPHGDPLR